MIAPRRSGIARGFGPRSVARPGRREPPEHEQDRRHVDRSRDHEDEWIGRPVEALPIGEMAPDRRREDVGETAREVDVPESPGLLDAGPAMRHLRLGEHEQHAGESDQELTEDDEPHLIDADRPRDREVPEPGDPHRRREHGASPVSVRKPSRAGAIRRTRPGASSPSRRRAGRPAAPCSFRPAGRRARPDGGTWARAPATPARHRRSRETPGCR